MYLQNKKMAKLWAFVNFYNRFGLNKYIKHFCKIKVWDELQKEEVVLKCFVKKVFLKLSQNWQENIFVGVSFLIKLQASGFIKKETETQVFPMNFVKFFMNTFFKEHVWWLLLYKRLIFVDFFVKEKVLKQIFFKLSGLTSSNIWNISFYMTK